MIKTDGKKIKTISVSDPSRKMSRIHLTVSGKVKEVGDNFKASWDEITQSSNISVELPQTVYAGMSVTIDPGQ